MARKTGNWLAYYWSSLRKNFWLFLGIIVLVTLIGFSLRYMIPGGYRTSGIFISHTIPGKYCSIMLDNLDKLSGSGNTSILGKELQIDEKMAATIFSINTTPSNDTAFIDRNDSSLSIFSVELILTNMQYLENIQKGLISYLENNSFAEKRKIAKIQSLESLKASLTRKIQSLDTVKNLVNSSIVPRGEGRGIILGEPINPVNVYQVEVLYSKELLKIDEELATSDNIETLQPFLRFNEYNYPKFNRILLYFFIASVIGAFIFTPIYGRKPKPESDIKPL